MTQGSKASSELIYKRVMLKISGESLMGSLPYGIDPEMVGTVALQVRDVAATGVEVCLVIGGGNIFRGMSGAAAGMERATGDYMGMLATVMNALAMQNALEQLNVPVRVQSALNISAVCEPYIRRRQPGTSKKDVWLFLPLVLETHFLQQILLRRCGHQK